jgi:hypothetical protein
MPDASRAASIMVSVIKEGAVRFFLLFRYLHFNLIVDATVSHVLGSRGWNVGVVSEFFPKNPSLLGLNVNRGREIKLRLRHAHE